MLQLSLTMRKQTISVPNKKIGAYSLVKFLIKFTNLTNITYGLRFDELLPELKNSNNQIQKRNLSVIRSPKLSESDFYLLLPEENIIYQKEAKLFWVLQDQIQELLKQPNYSVQDHLRLGSYNGSLASPYSSIWFFHELHEGSWKIRFVYSYHDQIGKIPIGRGEYQEVCANMWTKKITSLWQEIKFKY